MPAACCLVALAFTWAAMSFFGFSSQFFAAHAFIFATGSHASVAGWDRPTCVPCRQSFLVCLLWLCLALVRRLECLCCLKMQMVYSVCTSTSSRPESRLRLRKCNIWAALRASPLVLRRHHASPRSGPDTPALFSGRLDHLSAAAWVSPPCLMRVLRLPPVQKPDYQPGERTQGDLASTNSQGQGPKHPDVACSPSVFCGLGFL